jgi:hypothetical protein
VGRISNAVSVSLQSSCSSHLSRVWTAFSQTSCCSPSGGFSTVVTVINVGPTTWKQCLGYANQFGAMLYPGITSGSGWGSHREPGPSANAHYRTGNQVSSQYAQMSISANYNCVLARSSAAGSNSNNIPLLSSTVYDGDTWLYTDFSNGGALNNIYYDQCQAYATQSGASIITPSTIGLSGDYYWLAGYTGGYYYQSIYLGNTITADFAGSGGSRSPTRYIPSSG